MVELKHHLLQHPWVRRMHCLPPSLKHEIESLAFGTTRTPGVLLPAGELHDFGRELDCLRAVDPVGAREEFAAAVLGAT